MTPLVALRVSMTSWAWRTMARSRRPMIGGDQHAVLRGQELRRQLHAGHLRHVVMPHLAEPRDVRIVVAEHRPAVRSSSISSNDGLSRGSSTSFLYATPSTQICSP